MSLVFTFNPCTYLGLTPLLTKSLSLKKLYTTKGGAWDDAYAHLKHLDLKSLAERSGANLLGGNVRRALRETYVGDTEADKDIGSENGTQEGRVTRRVGRARMEK